MTSIKSNKSIINSLFSSPSNLNVRFDYLKYSADETISEFAEGLRKVSLSFGIPPAMNVDSTERWKEFFQGTPIHRIGDLSSNLFTCLSVKDTALLKRAQDSFLRSCKLRSIAGSLSDKSYALSAELSLERNGPSSEEIQAIASSDQSRGLIYYSVDRVIQSTRYSKANGIHVSATISNKVIHEIAYKTEEINYKISPTSIGLLANESTLQKQSEERSRGSSYFPGEIETYFEPTERAAPEEITLICFLIERSENLTSGEKNKVLFYSPPTVGLFVDTSVRYGSSYTYTVSAVYSAKVESISPLSDSLEEYEILVSSLPSNVATIFTIEKVPPPPPVDIRFRFDQTKGEFSVSWEFPVNRPQDITRFQVFRRRDENEPFLLLKEFDFDVSERTFYRPDAPLQVNVARSEYPVRRFIDRDFGRSSRYIYAICSVDAHGYVSNYSSQYEVSFDVRNRGLRVKCLSPSGAPRPYPNMYFDTITPLVEDSITRGNISSVDFVFDPEYLTVLKRMRSMNFLKYSDEAKYYMSVLDTTRAEQISVPIEIVEDRIDPPSADAI